jgi:beta-N-acetylhexosaminidase
MVFKKAPVLLFFFGFVSALLCPLDFDSPASPAPLARILADSMSDEQALAQCFMLGWVGAEPSPLILDWIRDRNIGGIKIFGWNTGDTKRLAATVGSLQKAALESGFGIPLFVATDQEGGMVRHVKGSTSETPGNMAIGASGRPVDAYWSGYYIGAELSLLGVNMNFAPAVDLYTNRESVLIGSRSFGNDPVQAGILGAAFVKGLATQGVIATAKHFPGHGDTSLDSHGVLPRIDATFETIWDRELVPYRLLAREGLAAIMTGHLAFPNTKAGEAPASLSSWFLKDILREKIGYKGLIITDDLMMNGATVFAGSLSRAAKQALLAGNDIIMLSKTPNLYDPVWTFLLESMKDEAVFRDRVRDAARRIIEVKLEYLRGENKTPYIPDLKKVEEGLSSPESSAFFLDLAARSVTIVKGSGVLPLDRKKAGRVLLAGQYPDFFSVGKKAYPGAVSFWYSSQASPEFLYYARNSDTIIFCLSGEDGLKPLSALKELGKRIIVFSVLSPSYLENALWADAAIAVYSYSPDSFVAGFSAMLGRIKAEGKIPFPGNPAPPELPPGTGQ